jgi:serine/threonine protein kinase
MPHPPYPGLDFHPRNLQPGTEVNGFRLVRHVATGGWGCVWQVENVQRPGHFYALKFSLFPPAAPLQADARAEREVQLLMRAAHPNVVRVVGHGRWKDPESGLRYVVLDWVEGGTLLDWARRTNPTVRELVRLGQKLVRALQAAHDEGVLHRDMKPGNVLMREADGEPFLADFGAASADFASPLTQSGLPPCTLAFLSPQALASSQRAGGVPYRFRPADDWYAVGVLLYQLFTEALPFPDTLAGEGLERWVMRRRPVPVHQLNPRIPPALGQVVGRLLSKEPALRYRTGHSLHAALEHALEQRGEWDAPVYQPRPPGPSHVASSQAPALSDGVVAQNPEVQDAHLLKAANGHEVRRMEAALRRRDTLLVAQPRVWPPWMRRAAAATLLLGALAMGGWAAWPWLADTLHPAPPVAAPQPTPPAQVSVAASALPPTLATPTATALKEDDPVKSPQPPPPPPASSPLKPSSKAARLSALCTAAGLAAGCSSVPVRPEPAECPAEAIESMAKLLIGPGDAAGVKFDSGGPQPVGQFDEHHFRPGPIVSVVMTSSRTELPPGTLLFGRVLAGSGNRFFIRYTQAQLPNSPRVPICAIAQMGAVPGGFGLVKAPSSTSDRYWSYNGGLATFVFQYAE